jgi:tetratricopeptide (TPR) repeat protein
LSSLAAGSAAATIVPNHSSNRAQDRDSRAKAPEREHAQSVNDDSKKLHERAARDYDEAIRLKPTLGAAWNGRCWSRAIVGELQAALADAAAAYDSRGLTQLKLGEWDLAIDDYSSALRLDPKLASSLYGRGVAKRKKGDPTGDADVAAARKIKANIGDEYVRYGVP